VISELAGATGPVETGRLPVPDAAAIPPRSRAAPPEEPAPERETPERGAGVAGLNRSLRFRVHEGTGRIFAQVVDRGSGEVLRTIPSEELLQVLARVREMVGLILDRQS
jgi:flagellar protein FlaG